ncbi:MAG TPA: hypothetical protein VNG53_00680 [Bacteroidia bacterium]|nr:hypothetical protein [Bacteroidia bacterium]
MKNILKWNAEFAKNIWLEFSPQRLIAMPAIIMLVVALIFSSSSSPANAWNTIHYAALAGFVIVGLLWGIKMASDAILDEYNEKTWDWQKMSIIGARKLAFGKLFGSTLYNWYGAILCWILFMISTGYSNYPENQFKVGILLIISMIALHGIMILITLQMVRKADGRAKIKSNRVFIFGIFFLVFISRFFTPWIPHSGYPMNLNWYFIPMNSTDRTMLSALFYCAWIIAGLYRSMRAELQFSDTPVWWVLFLISNFFFQYGFFINSPAFHGTHGLAYCFAIVFSETLFILYFLSLSESKDIVNFRLLLNALKEKKYRSFFQNVPLWITTLPIAFMFGLFAFIFFAVSPTNNNYTDALLSPMSLFNFNILFSKTQAFCFFIAVMGFVIRDLGILLLLNFSTRSKRADTAMVVYLILLYIVLPLLTKDLGIGLFFYPDITSNSFSMLIFPLVEAALVLFLVAKRWKEMYEAKAVA